MKQVYAITDPPLLIQFDSFFTSPSNSNIEISYEIKSQEGFTYPFLEIFEVFGKVNVLVETLDIMDTKTYTL